MLLRLSPSPIARSPRNVEYAPGRDFRLPYPIELDAGDYPLGTTMVSASLVAEASFGLAPLVVKTITAAPGANGQITNPGATGIGALYFALAPGETTALAAAPVGFEVIVVDSLGRQATLDLGSLVPTVSTAGKPVDHVVVAPKIFAVQDPNTTQLTATPYDVDGNALTGRLVNWTSSDPTVATIDPVSGLVTGVGAGAVLFTATIEGQSDTSTGTFTTNVTTVGVAPNPAVLPLGNTLQLIATPRDAGGNVVPNQTLVWASSDPTIATINQAGLVTSVALGVATIIATVNGTVISGNTALTIEDEIARWSRIITGGSAAVQAIDSVRYNRHVTTPPALDALDDARGAVGFAPTVNKTGAGTVSLLGSGPADWYIKPDGVSGILRSAVDALLNAGPAFTLVYIGTDEQGGAPLDLEDATDANTAGALVYMSPTSGIISMSVSPYNGIWPNAGEFPGATQTSPPASNGRIRVVFVDWDGVNTASIQVGLMPAATRTPVTAIPSRALRIAFGGQTQNGLYAPNKIRGGYKINHRLSSAERAAVYQLAIDYHNAPPNVAVWDGDSNTYGTGLGAGGGGKLSDRTQCVVMARSAWPTWADPNTGIPGAEIRSGGSASLLDNYTAKVRPILLAATGKRIVVLGNGAGGNDLDLGARTGAQVWADMLAYNALVQADRGVLVVTTPLARVKANVNITQAQYNTERANLRGLINANAAANGIFVGDLGGAAALASDTPNPAQFQGDSVHLNTAGHLTAANVTEPAVTAAALVA